jgi:uncharacterized membrane protein YphA (DoxX/SURF4 family)
MITFFAENLVLNMSNGVAGALGELFPQQSDDTEAVKVKKVFRHCLFSIITACAVFVIGILAVKLAALCATDPEAVLPRLQSAFLVADLAVLGWAAHSWWSYFELQKSTVDLPS